MAVQYSLAFFNGVRLWQNAKALRVMPATGSETRKIGMSRTRGLIAPRSPNFINQIQVNTTIPPIDSDMAQAKSALSGMGRQATRMIYTLKTFDRLMDESRSFGHLAWVEDHAKVLTVTGGPYSGGLEPVAVTGSGWTPQAGDLALFCNPSTGDGRVVAVVGFSLGAITGLFVKDTLTRDRTTNLPVTEDWAVSSGYKVYKVQYYYPRTIPLGMEDGIVPSRAEDKYAEDIVYRFLSESGVVYPSTATLDFS